jgi:hypothetical protein
MESRKPSVPAPEHDGRRDHPGSAMALRQPDRGPALASGVPPVHDARALTAGGSAGEIVLDGTRYVLRITRQGKLILTK